MWTQTIANILVVDDRSMKNVHVVDNSLPWLLNGGSYAVVSSHTVHKWLTLTLDTGSWMISKQNSENYRSESVNVLSVSYKL